MTEFLASARNWEHTLAVLLLIARLGDVGSTYLVTPTLRFEANGVARKLGRPFVLLTLLVCVLPYFNTALAMVAIVMSLLATSSNLSRGWLMRALGEAEYAKVLQQAAARSSRRAMVSFILGSAAACGLVGLLLIFVSGGAEQWAFWIGVGVIMYATAFGWHLSRFTARLFAAIDPARTISHDPI